MDQPAAPPARTNNELQVTAKQTTAIKRRLLDRVADADQSHLTVTAEQEEWQAFIPGVRIKVLYEQGNVLSYFLRLEAGACLPAHRHPVDEECLVLEGSIKVGASLEMRAGAYHLARQGALHAPISTRDGATIFLRGATPAADQLLA